MVARADVAVCGSDAELEGSDVEIGGSNAEVVRETGAFSPLRVGVPTLSGLLSVVDSASEFSSSCSSETSISAGKVVLDVTSLGFVTAVM